MLQKSLMCIPVLALVLLSAGCATEADQPQGTAATASVSANAAGGTASVRPAGAGSGSVAFAEAKDDKDPNSCEFLSVDDVKSLLGRDATPYDSKLDIIGFGDKFGGKIIQACKYETSAGQITYIVKKYPTPALPALEKERGDYDAPKDLTLGDKSFVGLQKSDVLTIHRTEIAVGEYLLRVSSDNKDTVAGEAEMLKVAEHILKKAGA